MAQMTMPKIEDYLGTKFMKKIGSNPIGGNLIPARGSAFDIGSAEKPIKSLYVDNIVILGSSTGGTIGGGGGDPTYLHADGSIPLTGNLTVAGGVTIDGTDISAHVADPDAHHNRQHNVTSASDHQITGAAYSVMGVNKTTANTLAILTTSNDATDEQILRTNSDGRLGVNQLMTQSIVSKTGVSGGNITIAPVSGGSILIPNQRTIRSEDFDVNTIPYEGWSIHNRLDGITPTTMSELVINRIIADEMRVKIFVADETRVDRGTLYITKGYGLTARIFTTPGSIGGTATIYFENSPSLSGALFSTSYDDGGGPDPVTATTGDWIMLQLVDFSNGGANISWFWGRVYNYVETLQPGGDGSGEYPAGEDPDEPGEQSWTYIHKFGDLNAELKVGSIALNFGLPGQGYIKLDAVSTSFVPAISIIVWGEGEDVATFAPYHVSTGRPDDDNGDTKAVMGHLYDALDNDLSPEGWGFFSDNAYLAGILKTPNTLINHKGVQIYGESQADFNDFDVFGFRKASVTDNPLFAYTQGYWDASNVKMRIKVYDTAETRNSTMFIESFSGGSNQSILRLQARNVDTDAADGGALIYMETTAADSGRIAITAENYIDIRVLGASGGSSTHRINVEGDFVPVADYTYDLGSTSGSNKRWRNLYVQTIVADSITTGGTLTGNEWEFAGNMKIDANHATDTTVTVINDGAGVASLAVEGSISAGAGMSITGSISVTGNVDGVDISAFKSTYDTHAANATGGSLSGLTEAHHNRSHNIESASDHVISGETTGHILRVIDGGANTFGFGTISAAFINDLTEYVQDIVGSSLFLPDTNSIDWDYQDVSNVLNANVKLHATSGMSITGTGLQIGAGSLITVGATTVGITPAGNNYYMIRSNGSGVSEWASIATLGGAGLVDSNGVLAVGAGTMITVNAGDVQVSAGANYQFIGTGSGTAAGWRNVSELAGDGLSATNGVLAIDLSSNSGLEIVSDELSVNLSSNSGLEIVSGELSVNLAGTSGLEISSGELLIADSIAGAGLDIASKVLFVGAGAGITVLSNSVALTTPGTLHVTTTNSSTGSHTHEITSSPTPGEGQSLLATDITGLLTLYRLTVTDRLRTPLIDTLAGDLFLDPDSNITLLHTLYASDIVRVPEITATSTLTLNPVDYVILNTGKQFRSVSYTPGFVGAGFVVEYDNIYADKSYIEVDNMTVRGTMNIYELMIQQIRATNGNIFVSSTLKVGSTDGSVVLLTGVLGDPGSTYTIYVEEGDLATVSDNDIMRAQRWAGGTELYQSSIQITDIALDLSSVTATLLDGDAPAPGYDYARLGNTTNDARKGGVYLSGDDAGAPYIQVWNGVDAYTDWNTEGVIKAQFGRLDAITGNTNEYGIFAGDAGQANTASWLVVGTTEARFNNIPITMYNSGVKTGEWQADGDLFLSDVSVDTSANRAFEFIASTGALRVGKVASNQSNLLYDAGVLSLRNNETPMVQISTAGVVTVGPNVNSRSRIVIDSTTGIQFVTKDGIGSDSTYITLSNAGDANFVGSLSIGSPATGYVTPGEGVRLIGVTVSSVSRSYRIMEPGDVNAILTIGGYRSSPHNISDILVSNLNGSGNATLNIDANASNGIGSIYINAVGTGTSNDLILEMNNPSAPGAFTFSVASAARLVVNSSGITVTGTITGNLSGNVTGNLSGNVTGGTISGSSITSTSSVYASNGGVAGPAYSFTSFTNYGMYVVSGELNFAVAAAERLSLTSSGATVTGTVSASSGFRSQNGTVSAPGHSFTSFTNYGMYATTNELNFTVAGTERLSLTATGAIVTGTLAATGAVSGTTGTFSSAVSGTTGTFTGVVSASVGTVSSAGFQFAGAANYGMYLSASAVRIAVAGVNEFTVSAGGASIGGTLAISGTLTGVTSLTMGGVLSGVTNLSMSGQLSGGTTISVSSTILTSASGSSGSAAIGWSSGAGIYKSSTRAVLTGDTSWGILADNAQARIQTGSAGTPSLAFESFPTYGLYYATSAVRFSTNGTEAMRIDSSNVLTVLGNVRVPDGGTGAPTYSFTSETDTGFYKAAANGFRMAVTGVDLGGFFVSGGVAQWGIAGGDWGSTASGSFLSINRNSNATSAAGGKIQFVDRGGTTFHFHVDDSGTVRVGTTNPIGSADTTNGAVGAQSSALAFKDVIGMPLEADEIFSHINLAAKGVRRFVYKEVGGDESETRSRPFNGEEFSGIVVDYAPRYGTDKNEFFPDGQSLNVINALGDLMIAADWLVNKVNSHESRIKKLETLVH